MTSASFRSVPDLFLHRVSSTPDSDAFYYPEGGSWKTMDWREAGARARAIACGLLALGLKSEERCAVMSSTRVEWILADMGILCAGGATTTVYPSDTPQQCAYIIGQRSDTTDDKLSLNDALRTHGIAV